MADKQACDQCGKPAMYNVMGHPLCLDCCAKHEAMVRARTMMMREHVNFLLDQAEATTGLHGVTPRYKITKPVIHQGPMNFHNIKVDNSVVGAINTGMVGQIDVALDHVQVESGSAEVLKAALKEFTEGTLREESLTNEAKNEILEQLAFLTTEITKPKQARVVVVLKALAESIAVKVATTGLADLWNKIRQMVGH